MVTWRIILWSGAIVPANLFNPTANLLCCLLQYESDIEGHCVKSGTIWIRTKALSFIKV